MSNKNFRSIQLDLNKTLLYATEDIVRNNIENQQFSGVTDTLNLESSDLQSGIYEGGLKIWEGSLDLCNYMIQNPASCPLKGKRILELGCGAALPSITALLNGAVFAVVNDFCFSRENFLLNNVPDDKWMGVSGDWADLAAKTDTKFKPNSFDMILTSETIYNERNFEALHNAMETFLTENGRILLAAKAYYFGLGASIIDFEEFVTKKNIFKFKNVWVSAANVSVPRKIIQLTRI